MTDSQYTFTLLPDRLTDRPYWFGHIPFAMWLVGEVQPKVIVELGTETGVSLSAISQAVALSNHPTKVYGVDTWEGDINTGPYDSSVYGDLTTYLKSKDYSFVELLRTTFDEAVARFEDGSIDILHIDGCHTYEAVKHDFETWRAKLSSRGVIMFHDTAVSKDDFGVDRFWLEVKDQFPSFQFPHSNGLGVLLIGPDQPMSLLRLSQAEMRQGVTLPAKALLSIFEALGQRVLYGHEANQKVHEAEASAARAQALFDGAKFEVTAEQEKVAYALILLEEERALHRQHLEADQKRLSDAQASFQADRVALLKTSSWRLTAPLRWLSNSARRAVRVSRRVAGKMVSR